MKKSFRSLTQRTAMFAIGTGFFFVGCGGSSSDTPSTPTNSPDTHILGSGAVSYTEAQETSNSLSTTPENTNYTLTSDGLAISGTIESSSPSSDYFKFNSGSYSHAVVRAFVNNTASTSTIKVQCQGYSAAPSIGSASKESSVSIVPNLSCNLIVFPATTEVGTTYTIEIIGQS